MGGGNFAIIQFVLLLQYLQYVHTFGWVRF
jgi:hypothetical protein